MSGPSIDLEKPNAIGGLDRLVTSFALSVIAVIPTFWACIVTPWRLRALVDRDDPDGRIGMLLAPGAFFPLSIMVTLIVAGLLATPETLGDNGAFIGPGLAISVQSAASEGNVWKIIATVMPLYGIAIFFGLLGMVLKALDTPRLDASGQSKSCILCDWGTYLLVDFSHCINRSRMAFNRQR